jgi:hypothetical protein
MPVTAGSSCGPKLFGLGGVPHEDIAAVCCVRVRDRRWHGRRSDCSPTVWRCRLVVAADRLEDRETSTVRQSTSQARLFFRHN